MTYIGDWEKMTERMGFWVNLDEAYYTLNNSYIESVWNLLQKIWDKDLIYRGYKVVPYDPRIGATLSSHELALGYKEVEDPSITVRFKVAGEDDTYFLVWTTTPWTLPSNLALAVGEDIDYSYCESEGQTLIVAEALREAVFRDIEHAVVKTVKGAELVGMRYEQLFDYLEVDAERLSVCRPTLSARKTAPVSCTPRRPTAWTILPSARPTACRSCMASASTAISSMTSSRSRACSSRMPTSH